MKSHLHSLAILAFLTAAVAMAGDDEIFEPGDHCVAYRTSKSMLFVSHAEIIGRNCDVTASLLTREGEAEPRIVVEVPIEKFKSRNFLRDRSVADILQAKTQAELRFTSQPLDAESFRETASAGRIDISGTLTIGGRDFPLDFPLEVVEHQGRHFVKGRLSSTFAAFDVEVPTVAGGLIARPHESLELLVHLELERVDGLVDWAQEHQLP